MEPMQRKVNQHEKIEKLLASADLSLPFFNDLPVAKADVKDTANSQILPSNRREIMLCMNKCKAALPLQAQQFLKTL